MFTLRVQENESGLVILSRFGFPDALHEFMAGNRFLLNGEYLVYLAFS